jgi:heptosyltransferase-2
MDQPIRPEEHVLLIQTSFIGDVILATSLLETLKQAFPALRVDMLVRKGNEGVLKGHPKLNRLWVWDKKGGKYRNWWNLLQKVRAEKYDRVINLQRFASMGLFTWMSGGSVTVGYDSTPFSRFFTSHKPHQLGDGTHEIQRNFSLLPASFPLKEPALPRVYPARADFAEVMDFKATPYLCIAPASVWFTKQYPAERWAELIQHLPIDFTVYLIGAPGDYAAAEDIRKACPGRSVSNLCGKLSLLQSAALMKDAVMNYVNDSAPLHLCTATGAPVTAVFCSTVPAFGFTPIGPSASVVEVNYNLSCRPCGIHGHKQCPKGHFRCAYDIRLDDLLAPLSKA